MRHRKKFNHLGRKVGHRKAMLSNMASSLLIHKRIKTTTAKAKALRIYLEPLITKTKNLTTVEEKTHAQRVVFSYLKDKHAVKELFSEIAPKVESRPGGYTRILKTGTRAGDNAEMCFIELVDYNENMLSAEETKKASGKRSRRGKKKTTEAAATTEQATAAVKTAEETKVEDAATETPAAEELKAEATEEAKEDKPADEETKIEEGKE